ncbi:alpha-tocopherol transfer protein-like isoform X6 [Cherax quadricarinatus]|uniref:alpha-tocopherol transfer protein-like isoform X6 n=1 Tax=Cherax quadricarinatus TaxID=27406 RepID=UPI00387E6E3C
MVGEYVCTLSEELLQRAKEEINEVPERRADDIEHIRDWLKHQPHITARLDDWTILRFLRGCKFSLQRTKEKLDMFYTCKTLCPEWYKNRDPQDKKIRAILELGVILPLPGYETSGSRVVITRWGRFEPSKLSLNDLMKASLAVIEVWMDEDEQASVTAMVTVEDCQSLGFSHITALTPSFVKKASALLQEGYPMRPKGLHYINTPAAFDTVFNIFKSFMKEKMRKRVHIHGTDMESLYRHVPKSVLPVEYGGTNGTIEEITKYWIERLDARRDWLLEDEKYVVDESKRPGKAKTSAELFGLEGSFRKLNVD